jgi:hypothetical protein
VEGRLSLKLDTLNPATLHKEKTPEGPVWGGELLMTGHIGPFPITHRVTTAWTTWEVLPASTALGRGAEHPLSPDPVPGSFRAGHRIKISPHRLNEEPGFGKKPGAGSGEGAVSFFCLQLPLFVNKHSVASSPPPESCFCWREKSYTILCFRCTKV